MTGGLGGHPVIELQGVLGRDLSSRAIAWFSSGHLSHIDAVLPPYITNAMHIAPRSLLGARSDRVGGRPRGVEIRPPNYEPWRRVTRIVIPCTEAQQHKAYAFYLSQLGKGYDQLAIWAFALDRTWREEDTWICSELATRGLELAFGRQLYLAASKITPVACMLVATALGGLQTADVFHR